MSIVSRFCSVCTSYNYVYEFEKADIANDRIADNKSFSNQDLRVNYFSVPFCHQC